MKEENYILLKKFCQSTSVDPDFIEALYEFGLIEHASSIHKDELPTIERYVRLHYDLNVNIEGLQIIANMREKMMQMQEEMLRLERKLKRFEE